MSHFAPDVDSSVSFSCFESEFPGHHPVVQDMNDLTSGSDCRKHLMVFGKRVSESPLSVSVLSHQGGVGLDPDAGSCRRKGPQRGGRGGGGAPGRKPRPFTVL